MASATVPIDTADSNLCHTHHCTQAGGGGGGGGGGVGHGLAHVRTYWVIT